MTGEEEDVDLAGVVAAVRDEVQRRRAAGEIPPAVDRIVATSLPPAKPPLVETSAMLDTVRPLAARPGPLRPVVIGAKRLIRRAVAWYVRPIVADQVRVNLELLARLDAVEARLGDGIQTAASVRASPERDRRGSVSTVHQLLPSLALVDAIGADTLAIDDMLRTNGVDTAIWAETIDPRLDTRASRADGLAAAIRPGDVVLYHLSIGSPLAGMLASLPNPLVLVYHNMTPPEYYENVHPRVTYWLRRGVRDLTLLAPRADLVVADSSFNLAEAAAAGARDGVVVPPFVALDRLAPRTAAPTAPPTLLFVGRIAANKRHDRLLQMLAVLRASGRDVRLVCAGHARDNELLLDRLHRLAAQLRITDALSLTGLPVTDLRLGDLYATSAAFVCASEHEGFCAPLVEAMAFGLPIVAHPAAAVPETVGDAGLLVDASDPLCFATAVGRVLDDVSLRAALASRGRRRVEALATAPISTALLDALARVGVVPGVAPGAGQPARVLRTRA